jgi:energy-coupling factor transporter transmembrane protein EcfT
VTSKTIKLAGSFVFAVIIALILLIIVWILKDSLAWLSLALGLAGGWAAGVLLAPYQSEQDRFREYVKVASAFITGYGVSKLDRLFELWLDPARGLVILSQPFAHRVLICITSFLLAAVSTYVSRKYLSFGPNAEQPPKANP